MADNIFQQPNLSVFGEPTTPVDYSGLTGATRGTVFDPLMQYLSAGATIASQKQAAENLAKQKEQELILQQQDAARGKEYAPSEYEKLLAAKQKADQRGDKATADALQKRLDRLSAVGGSAGGTITLPDGTVINTGSPLTTTTTTGLQKDVVAAQPVEILSGKLSAMLDAAPPEIFQVESRAKVLGKDWLSRFESLKDIPETQMTEKDRQFLKFYRGLSSTAQALKSSFLKSVSGATVTDKEMARLDAVLPSVGGVISFDSLESAKAKLAEFMAIQKAVQDRYNYLLQNKVITADMPPADLKKAMEQYPLEAFGDVPAAPTATQAAPETPELPERAVKQLKEGVSTTFANGQVWTLQAGKPMRVK